MSVPAILPMTVANSPPRWWWLHPHYAVNVLLCGVYVLLRVVPQFQAWAFPGDPSGLFEVSRKGSDFYSLVARRAPPTNPVGCPGRLDRPSLWLHCG